MDRQNLKQLLLSSLNPQLRFQHPKMVKVMFEKRSQFKGQVPNRSITVKYPIKNQLKIFSPPLTTYQTDSYQKFEKNIKMWKDIQNPQVVQLGKRKRQLLIMERPIQSVNSKQCLSELSFQNSNVGNNLDFKQQSRQTIVSSKTSVRQVGKIVQKPLKKRRNSLSTILQLRIAQRKKQMTTVQLKDFSNYKKPMLIQDKSLQTQNTIEQHFLPSKLQLKKTFKSDQFKISYKKQDDPFDQLQICIIMVENMSGKIKQLRSSIHKNLERSQHMKRSSSTSAINIRCSQDLDLLSTKHDCDSKYYDDKRELLQSTQKSSLNGSYLKSLQKRFGDLSNLSNLQALTKTTSYSYLYETPTKKSLFESS